MLFGASEVFIILLAIFVVLIPLWRICSKAGYSGAWSLLIFIPLVPIIMVWIFAFTEWPIERTLK